MTAYNMIGCIIWLSFHYLTEFAKYIIDQKGLPVLASAKEFVPLWYRIHGLVVTTPSKLTLLTFVFISAYCFLHLYQNASPISMLTYKGDLILSLKYVTADNAATNKVRAGNKRRTGKGELHVLLKEARNLTAVRANGFSDPFCKGYVWLNLLIKSGLLIGKWTVLGSFQILKILSFN